MHVLRYAMTWNQLVYMIPGLFAHATLVTGALYVYYLCSCFDLFFFVYFYYLLCEHNLFNVVVLIIELNYYY